MAYLDSLTMHTAISTSQTSRADTCSRTNTVRNRLVPTMLTRPRLNMEVGGIGYGVVPKGLSTFLGSLYKEVAKTIFGVSLRETNHQGKKKNLPSKNTVSSTYNVGFCLRNLHIAAFCILMSSFMKGKLKKISIHS